MVEPKFEPESTDVKEDEKPIKIKENGTDKVKNENDDSDLENVKAEPEGENGVATKAKTVEPDDESPVEVKRATRGRKPKPKIAIKPAPIGSHKIFYLSDELCSADVKLVHLRNPCTGMAARYICQHDRQQYFELMQFGDPFRSWFVNDVLTIDGSIYMTTVVDPLFLVLHYLEQECSKHFVPLENALKDNAFPAISTFTDALPLSQLLLVCDQKGPDEMKAVKFNMDKTLRWLTLKCNRLRTVLEQRKFYVDNGAKSATFVKSEKLQTEPDQGGLLVYAAGMLGEYISLGLAEKLAVHLGLDALMPKPKSKPPVASHKRKSTTDAAANGKRAKTLCDVEDEMDDGAAAPPPPVPSPKEKKQSAKEKAMVKAASGSKNIMSFFKKK